LSWRYAVKWLAIGAVAGVVLVAIWVSLDLAFGVSTVVAGRALLLVGMTTATGLIVGAGQIVWRRFWSGRW
jgi:hypothetical protein